VCEKFSSSGTTLSAGFGLSEGIIMSIDYEFAGWFPFADPADAAMRILAEVLGAPATTSTLEHQGLRVVADVPEPDEQEEIRKYLGFDGNLTLLFTPYGADDLFAEGQRAMLRSMAALGRRGVRGLLFGDYGSDESLILALDNGRLTLNESWTGWHGPPDLKAAVPQPYETSSLTFAGRNDRPG
jgi:hypothetical protein